MNVHLDVRNASSIKRVYRGDNLRRIAGRVCAGEGVDGPVEVSLLLCDDPFITQLNRQYRGKDAPTDVLSFAQQDAGFPGTTVLGDVIISLETVARYCENDWVAMRDEVRLLFCHGLLHLLGYGHAEKESRRIMQEKQAQYLGCAPQAAWRVRG